MPVAEIGDPRLQALFGADDPRDGGVRPVVRRPGRGVPPIAFAVAAVVLGVVLFAYLNARRTAVETPAEASQMINAAPGAWEPPPLYVPPAPVLVVQPQIAEVQKPTPVIISPAPVVGSRTMAPQPVYVQQPVPQLAPPLPMTPPPRASTGAPLVIDTGNGQSSGAAPVAAPGEAAGISSSQPLVRMRASALANRSMTVPQGHLIPAVLETGFDSTKGGFARAVVSRDVRGFDGKNVLIPRGSRLIGEYKSAVAEGQARAIIAWKRLIRPDGMTIAMEAPAVDPVGRGGVKARVNTHFFSRLGDALLQTTVEAGRALAGRAGTGPVVVVPQGLGSPTSQMSGGNGYVPTLTVAPGRSISVFVAQDLDFGAPGTDR